jgi:heme/copper-type cytochrome/quinol oxidase subunit 2
MKNELMFFIVEPCRGENCRSSSNFVVPLIISLVAIFLLVIILILIILFYLNRRRNRASKEASGGSRFNFIDQPPLYNDTTIHGISSA